MKKLLFIFSVFIYMTSCTIYEDVNFLENGAINYKVVLDGKEMLTMFPEMTSSSMSNDLPKGETISLAEKIKDSLDIDSPEIQKYLEAIEPLYISYDEDMENKKLEISVFGNFKNDTAYNEAVTALIKLQEKENSSFKDISFILASCNFFWDGKAMKRVLRDDAIINLTGDADETDDFENMNETGFFKKMFASGTMTVRYHFPQEIDCIDNEEALLTQDKKTIVLEYSSELFVNPDEKLNIEATTK